MKTNMSSTSLLVSAAAAFFVAAQIRIASSTINAVDPGVAARRRPQRGRRRSRAVATINSNTSTPVKADFAEAENVADGLGPTHEPR